MIGCVTGIVPITTRIQIELYTRHPCVRLCYCIEELKLVIHHQLFLLSPTRAINEELPAMHAPDLSDIALSLVTDNKGILAADESLGTIEKRLATIGLPSSKE